MFLVFQAFLFAIMGVALLDTRSDQTVARVQLRAGCARSNRRAEAQHWVVTHIPGFPDALVEGLVLTDAEFPQPDKPWLADCDAAFP
jgi:hypothetical protein